MFATIEKMRAARPERPPWKSVGELAMVRGHQSICKVMVRGEAIFELWGSGDGPRIGAWPTHPEAMNEADRAYEHVENTR